MQNYRRTNQGSSLILVSLKLKELQIVWLEGGLGHFLADLLSPQQLLAFAHKYMRELFIVTAIMLEWLTHANPRRYWSRSFASDLLHFLFYAGGFGTLLFFNPAISTLDPFLSSLKLGLVNGLPPLIAFTLVVICSDFVGYWLHRLQHTSRYLWVFHSVHHSATNLTPITSFRMHFADMLFTTVVKYALVLLPLQSVLSPPWPMSLALVAVGFEFMSTLQHAELNWHFGPFSRLLVSPVFHSVHHSLEREHHDKNFGMLFSTWDHLFGTAVQVEKRPARYGLEEPAPVSQTFSGQVFAPFKMFVKLLIPRPAGEKVTP